jgi:2-methylcitrate dehydratase
VVTTAGQRVASEVAFHRGHYKNPMSDQEVEAKFRTLAQEHLTARHIDAILERLWNLEQVDDIGEVISMIRI